MASSDLGEKKKGWKILTNLGLKNSAKLGQTWRRKIRKPSEGKIEVRGKSPPLPHQFANLGKNEGRKWRISNQRQLLSSPQYVILGYKEEKSKFVGSKNGSRATWLWYITYAWLWLRFCFYLYVEGHNRVDFFWVYYVRVLNVNVCGPHPYAKRTKLLVCCSFSNHRVRCYCRFVKRIDLYFNISLLWSIGIC